VTGKRRLGSGDPPPEPSEPNPEPSGLPESALPESAPASGLPDSAAMPGPAEPPELPASSASPPEPGPPEPAEVPTALGWMDGPRDTPVDMSTVIAAMPNRRQVRAERRRQFRKRVGLAGGAAILAVVLIVAAVAAFGVHKAVTHHHVAARSQTTVLFQIQGTDLTAAGSVLLAHDPATSQGVEVLIPTGLTTNVCGFGSEMFGKVLSRPNGATASRDAVTTMLNGVTVDGSWVVSEAQFEKLVNDIGGVTVKVDTDVVHRASSGVGTILVPKGTDKLNGAQALEYATYQASASEDASAVLARLQQVVDATIRALPPRADQIAALISPLGASGTSTLGVDRLSAFLAGLRADDQSESGVFPTDLPYTTIDAGAGQPAYRVDTSATGVPQLVKTYLAQSVPPGAGKPKPSVYLLNGVGNVGLVTTVCPKLAAHGLAYAGSNNAAVFSQAKSVVAIQSDNDVTLGDNVAKALGLPASDVELSQADQSIADVIVTLGSDYRA
jgi:LytR_cpsA_psr family/LytR cell envelope-related transcriptional attenuator